MSAAVVCYVPLAMAPEICLAWDVGCLPIPGNHHSLTVVWPLVTDETAYSLKFWHSYTYRLLFLYRFVEPESHL